MPFQDIKGQDRPIDILKDYFRQDRLQGGYLFIGPEGVGKKMVAGQLARQLNCLGGSEDPCDRCASCIKIGKGEHPDVHTIATADEEIKIESIRQLQRNIAFRPYEGKKKVFIIDNAHRMTPEAQNALLKILEEPPKDTLIILISDKPALLFKTVISRCRPVKFSSLPRQELKDVFRNEYKLSPAEAHFLAYFCEGRPGYALRLKDTDILKEKNSIIDRFAFSPRFSLDDLLIPDKGYVRGILNIMASWFRDIYLIKAGLPSSELINYDRREELLNIMGRFSYWELNEIFACISDSMLRLEQNINLRLLLHNLGSHLWKG